MVAQGSDVTIYVSSGADAVTVPDLAGRTEAQARSTLEGLKLTVGAVTEVDDSTQDKGKVVESTPAAGESVAAGTSVALKISSGKVTVPDLKGKTRAAALQELTRRGLVPVSYTHLDGYRSQVPASRSTPAPAPSWRW